ncbi:MAG: DivIVA domain-containing protein [Bacilli bacterium]|nr:DivIVA domain-containing protein [Bacilli bacterium]
METTNISLNANDILQKVFDAHGKGYDPKEVDEFLDQIMMDYQAFEKYFKESRDYIVSLEQKLRRMHEVNSENELELAKYKSRLGSIKEKDEVNMGNIDLMDRINKLENALYKLGGDPSSIK